MQLKRKQTSLLIITVLASLVFIWQLITLFTQDIAAAPPKEPENTSNLKQMPIVKPAVKTEIRLTPEEKQYTDLLQRYQLAKLEHQVLQEEVAISRIQAHLNKVQKNSVVMNHKELHQANQINQELPLDHPSLKFLAQQNGLWHAMVLWKQEWIKLHTHQMLSDAWKVLDINQNGVVLAQGGQQYLLGLDHFDLYPAIKTPVSAPAPAPAPMPTQTQISTLAKAPVNIDMLSLDHTILLSMPAQSYTLILSSDRNPQVLLALAKRHHLSRQTFLYRHQDNNPSDSPMYSLVYGDFLSKRAAERTISLLKEQAPALNPEVTTVAVIQKAIKGLSL